ncbi:hypothetical protein GCM10008018_54670 [Paenibacillus marchantiophytorum]|uniref:Zinc-binding dehydrogenase n=1 Tax=Paenibacillus marchantiophytorum TaxID=1619310 RepID=A0ABQ1F6Y0_9BACL|nr:hypothetical protein [Paenibacillus marchantiophytorum]GGA01466.1 hypothetical protein GCM10008018_54670 [Paenibacillus marchantiophytorum]
MQSSLLIIMATTLIPKRPRSKQPLYLEEPLQLGEQSLRMEMYRQGERVLIHSDAGGVGQLAIQIAKWRGTYVIGTARSGNIEFVRS